MIDFLEIRDSTYKLIGVVDTAKSIIWQADYYGAGMLEIYAALTDNNLDLLKRGRYVTRRGEKNAAIIDSVTYHDDKRDGLMITASGRMLKSILDRRLAYQLQGNSIKPIRMSGNLANAIHNVVQGAVGSTASAARTMGVIRGSNGGIGYSDYFENLDTEFNEWFADVKDKLASVTLFKQYTWSTTLTSSSDTVTFNIPQYDSTGVDIIQVYVNGLLEIPTYDYTLSGSVITFTQGKTAGTEINVICYKSIDGTGLGSVSDEITALQNAVDALGDVGQYYYFCTGSADNVAIYNAVSTFLSGGDDGKSLHLHICGNPGISAAILGSGTAASPYQWLAFGSGTSRKVILDFTNCGKWTITTASGTYNTVFSASANVTVKGITLKAGSASVSSDIIGASSKMRFEDCDIEIEGASTSLVKFAGAAELVNCKISVTNGLGNAAVIGAADSTLSTVNGGKLYAYTGESSSVSAIVYIPAGVGGKVAASMVQMPVVAKTGFYQITSIYAQSGKVLSVGQLTTLTADIGGTAEDTIIWEM